MLYHVCNKSDLVIFRSESDYFLFINKLAIISNKYSAKIFAFTIMSNHFHVVIECEDVDLVTRRLKQTFTQSWNNKYAGSIKLFHKLSIRELTTNKELIDAINYTLKNPLHHSVVSNILLYKYSTINYYFTSERNVKIIEDDKNVNVVCCNSIPARVKRKIFAHFSPSTHFDIIDCQLISPLSFIDFKSVEFYYTSYKKFMYEMTKPSQDEIALFKTHCKNDVDRIIDIKCNRLSDIQVCEMIDAFVMQQNDIPSFLYLNTDQKNYLKGILIELGVDLLQLKRCLYAFSSTSIFISG